MGSNLPPRVICGGGPSRGCFLIFANLIRSLTSFYHFKKNVCPLHFHISEEFFRISLFRKKRFEINFFVQGNASKFAIFIEKENPCSFFRFSFRATLSFTFPKLARLAQSKKGPIYSDSKYVMRISK